MIKSNFLPSKYGPASALGVAIAAIGTVVASKVLCDLPLPFTVSHWDQHLTGWLAVRLHELNPAFFPEIAGRYQYFLDHAISSIAPWKITWRFDFAALTGLSTGIWTTWLIGKPVSDTVYLSGRHLFEGKAAHKDIMRRIKSDIKRSGAGIKLHRLFNWRISRSTETTHVMVTGSVGSGKTVIIRAMLDEIIARGDKVLIYDNKGDMTATLPGQFAFFAPWDARSLAWDIAKDCTNIQDARELAAFIVPEGGDPIWHQAARMILGGIIQELQALKPGAWTWSDLHQQTCMPAEVLLEVTKRRAPEAITFIKENSRTTDSILVNLGASLTDVIMLSMAWGKAPPEKRFSLTEWLLDPNPAHKVLVLQGNGRYSQMTLGYIKAAISLLAGRIDSPELPDDTKRRIWFALDEFSSLKKLDQVGQIIAVGRSKGVCCILGVQNVEQLKAVYGDSPAKAWAAMIKTQIIGRVSPGETADFIAKLIVGDAITERTVMHRGELQPPKTETRWVMEPSEFSDYLGPTKDGVKAMVIGFGDAHILEWPYTNYEQHRPPIIPAKWTAAYRPPEKSNSTSHLPVTTPVVQSPPPLAAPKAKSSWVLRPPSASDVYAMAETGSDIQEAGEPLDDMLSQPSVEVKS